MNQFIKSLIAATKKALGIARRDRRAASNANNAAPTSSSTCILCNIRLPVVDVDGVAHHEARHGGKRVLLRCTRSGEVQAADRAGSWPTGW
jgi:hypothetical protein